MLSCNISNYLIKSKRYIIILINFDDDNLDEDNPGPIIHVRRKTSCNRFKQRKASKKEIDEKLMLITWYPTRVWDWCVKKDEKL